MNLRISILVAFRRSFRSPATAITVVGTLAATLYLVITLVAIADWVVLRPLPYPNSGRIVEIGVRQANDSRLRLSLEHVARLQASVVDLESIAVSRWEAAITLLPSGTERLNANLVNGAFFTMLGAKPIIGRLLTHADSESTSGPVVVISGDLWTKLYNEDPQVLGRSLVVNSQSYTVIGVAHPGFHDPEEYRRKSAIDMWLPLRTAAIADRRNAVYYVDGVRRQNTSPEQLQAQLSSLFAPAPSAAAETILAAPLKEVLTSEAGSQILFLLAAVGILLTIACANVGAILLARGVALRSESALKLSLGAPRSTLVLEFLVECTLFVIAGTMIAVLLSLLSLSSLSTLLLHDLPRVSEISMDWRVLMISMGIAAVSIIACGLFPAFSQSTSDPGTHLHLERGGGGALNVRRHFAISMFVAAQLGLSLILISGSGLLLKSFSKLSSMDTGMRTEGRIIGEIRLPMSIYRQPIQREALYSQLLERLRTIPGVNGAALSAVLPLSGSEFSQAFLIEGRLPRTNEQRSEANWNLISPGYFEVLKIPLLAGRLPAQSDLPAKRVVVISSQFAKREWPNSSPLGKRIRFGSLEDSDPWSEVIGVVGNVKHSALTAPPELQVYQLYSVLPPPAAQLIIDANASSTQIVNSVRRAIRDLDPNIPFSNVKLMDALRQNSLVIPRFRTIAIGLFSVLASLVAACGVYSTVRFIANQRRSEIGIRLAMGGSQSRLLCWIGWKVGRFLLLAIALGSCGAVWFMHILRSWVWGVSSLDAAVLSASAFFVTGVAALAVVVPAWNAVRTDPNILLRGARE